MAEPDNQTLRVLREIRTGFKTLDQRLGAVESRLDNIRQAINGENGLGRYAAAEVEGRLESLEKRIKALEGRR